MPGLPQRKIKTFKKWNDDTLTALDPLLFVDEMTGETLKDAAYRCARISLIARLLLMGTQR